MISFTDKRLYVKGLCEAIATDKATGDVLYFSNKFQTGNISTSVTMGEIRAGLGNAVAAIIPTDSTLEVDFTAADFSLWAKAAQVGGTLGYNAPVMTCQTVTATGASLTIDVSGGTPVAQVGFSDVFCYVQEVGAASPIVTGGVAYPLDSATGAVSDFVATANKQYKVWYFVNKASAQMATIGSLIDPKVVHFTAQMAVYTNEGTSANEGTRCGWLYVIVPSLKLGGNGGITGEQTGNDTTSLSGQAIVYDSDVVSDSCNSCDASANAIAYYIYCPDDASDAIQGLALVGGVLTMAKSKTAQLPVKFVMADGSLVNPASYSEGFTYNLTGITGTSISAAGVVTSGTTAGDGDCTVTYTDGTSTYTLNCSVTVTN